MEKQIDQQKVPAARVILDDETPDDAVIKSSIKFKKGNKNKPVLVITVGLGGLSKMVEDSWELNGDDPDRFRDADLTKDFFPPGQFNISFEKNGSASALMKIEATIDTKIPGTGSKKK